VKTKFDPDKAVAIEPLVTFRIIFGAMMVISTCRFMALGWIEDHYLKPVFHFKYFGFEWVDVLPPFWMYALHIIMILAAIGVMLGYFYRLSAALLFVTFTYTELIDLTYYLNHYYFVTLACALMVVLPANRYFSLDVLRNPALFSQTVPAWSINIIKFQLAIVYIFAGVAKMNYEWLINAMPLKIWMPANDNLPVIGWMLALPVMPYVFAWIGMLYDSTVVLWLSYKKTRIWAYCSVVVFHVVTGLMFQIGVFPIVMIGATLIFFSEKWHKKLISILRSAISAIAGTTRKLVDATQRDPIVPDKMNSRPLLKYLLVGYILFQIAFPLRYIFYPGNLYWTEQGYRFSWRVMLMEKAGTATFYIRDKNTNREGVVVNSEFLNAHQEKQMAMQPDMILQFAHFLKTWYSQHGVNDPQVRAEVYVTLNARPSKLLIDPGLNLANLKDNWAAKDWILSYEE
jgi:uncharacterized membrane protein YphA (DoxX/SURF4 family)